jgi:peptidoglycan/xylan/chitin deacetylase (PgdA/CDA1 family)
MEHGRFRYDPIGRRPPMKLPDGKRIAVWITTNIEHFHFDKTAVSLLPFTNRFTPDVLNYAWRDYGNRVGIWRLMEIYARHGIAMTGALNSDCCLYYPEIIEAANEQGWEWMAHGSSNSVLDNTLSEEEETARIKDVVTVIEQHTGKHPRGWLSPALTESHNTLDILAALGLEYVADWCNDDQPYSMTTRNGPIVALPYTLEIGDFPVFLDQGGSGEDFYKIMVDQFDVLYEEGASNARVLSVALHPFLIGHPYRARHLDRALAYMRGHQDVWFVTPSDILDWYLSGNSGLDPGR